MLVLCFAILDFPFSTIQLSVSLATCSRVLRSACGDVPAGELIIMQIGIVKVMGFAFAAEPVPGLGTVLSIKL